MSSNALHAPAQGAATPHSAKRAADVPAGSWWWRALTRWAPRRAVLEASALEARMTLSQARRWDELAAFIPHDAWARVLDARLWLANLYALDALRVLPAPPAGPWLLLAPRSFVLAPALHAVGAPILHGLRAQAAHARWRRVLDLVRIERMCRALGLRGRLFEHAHLAQAAHSAAPRDGVARILWLLPPWHAERVPAGFRAAQAMLQPSGDIVCLVHTGQAGWTAAAMDDVGPARRIPVDSPFLAHWEPRVLLHAVRTRGLIGA